MKCSCEWEQPPEDENNYCVPYLACIPLNQIEIPKPWNPERLKDARKWVSETSLNSVKIDVEIDKRFLGVDSFRLPRLSRINGGKYTIGDGIHRINTAKEKGISCVLAWVHDCVDQEKKG